MKKAFSKLTKRSGKRGQPKHSRGETACVKCAANKTKCSKSAADPGGRCEKCVSKGHKCVWPAERAGRACRQCRDAKIRCVHVRGQSTGHSSGAEHREPVADAGSGPVHHRHPEAGPSRTPPPVAGPSDAAIILNPEDRPVQPRLHVDTAYGYAGESPGPGTPPGSVASSPRSGYWSTVLSDDSR